MPSLQDTLKQTLLLTPANFAKENETTIQRRLAPVLRKLAVDAIEKGDGEFATQYREVCLKQFAEDRQDFAETKQNDHFAGYAALAALAERLQFTVKVSVPDHNRVAFKTHTVYQAADKNAPVFHLEYRGRNHWSANNKTLADGNCLFNALAQKIWQLFVSSPQKVVTTVSLKQPQPKQLTPAIKQLTPSLPAAQVQNFSPTTKQAIQLQHQRWNELTSNHKPITTPILTATPAKITTIPSVDADHQLVLQLAHEESQQYYLHQQQIKKQLENDRLLAHQLQADVSNRSSSTSSKQIAEDHQLALALQLTSECGAFLESKLKPTKTDWTQSNSFFHHNNRCAAEISAPTTIPLAVPC